MFIASFEMRRAGHIRSYLYLFNKCCALYDSNRNIYLLLVPWVTRNVEPISISSLFRGQ